MKYLLPILCALITFFLSSCNKTEIESLNDTDTGITPLYYTLMQQNEAPVQLFETTPIASTTSFTTSSGATVKVKGSAFKRYDDSPLSTAPIRIQVQEVTNRAEAIFNRLPTITVEWAGSKLLESAGMMRIKAFQDDKPLVLATGEVIQLTTRNPQALSTLTGMQLFTSYVGPAEDFGWQLVPVDSSSSITPTADNKGFNVTISSSVFNRMAWLNCDRLVPGTSVGVKVQVLPQNTAAGDFTNLFLVYKDLNSFIYTSYFSDQGTVSAPVLRGARVTAVVVRVTKDQICYYGEQTATITEPFTFTPRLTVLPAADVITRIRQAAQ